MTEKIMIKIGMTIFIFPFNIILLDFFKELIENKGNLFLAIIFITMLLGIDIMYIFGINLLGGF